MRNIIGIGLLGTFLLTGCLITDGSFHGRVDSFSLLKSDNPGLRRDSIATVHNSKHTINLEIPNYMDATNLVARIEWSGLTLSENGVPITKTKVPRDFTRPLTFSVTAKDHETYDYSVKVTRVPGQSTKELNYYALGRPGTAPYQQDYWYSYDWETLYSVRQDEVREMQRISPNQGDLRLFVAHTGYRVSLDGIALTNDNRLIDFTKAHTLTVEAEDLSTKDYVIKVQDAIAVGARLSSGSTLLDDTTFVRNTEPQDWVVVLPKGTLKGALTLYLTDNQNRKFPVTAEDGTVFPFAKNIPVDLTSPLVLTVTGPFLSQSYTISVKETP